MCVCVKHESEINNLFREKARGDLALKIRRYVTFSQSTATLSLLFPLAVHFLHVEALSANLRARRRSHDVAALLTFHPQLVHIT